MEATATAKHVESGAIVLFTGTTKARCSAIAVGPTTLLTANHCVPQDAARPAVWFMRAGEGEPDVGRLITRSVDRDLAWVQVGRPLVPVPLGGAFPGDELRLERPLWGGARVGTLLEQAGSFYRVGIAVQNGDSGAPVFNGAGELVGVMSACEPTTCARASAAVVTPEDSEVSP